RSTSFRLWTRAPRTLSFWVLGTGVIDTEPILRAASDIPPGASPGHRSVHRGVRAGRTIRGHRGHAHDDLGALLDRLSALVVVEIGARESRLDDVDPQLRVGRSKPHGDHGDRGLRCRVRDPGVLRHWGPD